MSGPFVAGPVSVRAPATSANLGPGFDALGLALDLHDQVSAEVVEGPTGVRVRGEGAGELPTDGRHLVVRAMVAAFEELGVRPPAVSVTCENRIPQARGLGSSAAAVVAGVLAARALAGGAAEGFDDPAVLRLATRIEGHPDNVAPCLYGGLTIAWTGADPGHRSDRSDRGAPEVRAVRLALAGGVRPTVFVPGHRGLTEAARAALPATVPHADAAHTAGRAALLVHALTAEPALLFEATEDRLHQPYRAAAAPATAALLARLRAGGVAVVVSGAGPSVLALSPVPAGFEAGDGWVRHVFEVANRGAAVRPGMLAQTLVRRA